MKAPASARLGVCVGLLTLAGLALWPSTADSMCGYFSSQPRYEIIPEGPTVPSPQVLQPAQIAFITWDPMEQVQSVTVQPRFEGNTADFGMVIPTPSKPDLHEMPRDFFKALAVFTTPQRRVLPPTIRFEDRGHGGMELLRAKAAGLDATSGRQEAFREGDKVPSVVVVEVGQVGNLDYKIISATRSADLYTWLKDNKYSFAGDEAMLDFYVKKKWFFTVMKIDTLQMKKNADGSCTGDVTPTRFTFVSDQLVYPMRITQGSVKDQTEAVFYIQAPHKIDLAGEFSYQRSWVSTLRDAQAVFGDRPLPGGGGDVLQAVAKHNPGWLKQELPQNRAQTTLQWAKRLTAQDIRLLKGEVPFSDVVPGSQFERGGHLEQATYLVRSAQPEDIKSLKILLGHLKPGQFLTKLHRNFAHAEMKEDLILTAAKVADAEDKSEYTELLWPPVPIYTTVIRTIWDRPGRPHQDRWEPRHINDAIGPIRRQDR